MNMKNQTRNYKRYLSLSLIVTTAALLQACGGSDPYGDNRYYSSYYQNAGGACQIPQGIKDRTVIGDLGNGATLTLDIFTQGAGGGIAAFGQLSAPSLESLFGVDVFNGNFNQYAPPTTGYGYTGPNSQFQTCVSTNGFSGTLDRGATYEDINLALVGNGNVYIEMGSRVGVNAFLSSSSLRGTIKVRVGAYPETEFILP